ncbi:MAG: ribonuclease III [Chloroflexi bacterium]|nr:ribonuclease III [Chloroflexota bacterium]
MTLSLSEFQDQLGISFQDEALLKRSLVHPSYLNENPARGDEDNQRLEFLGDAILDFVSGEWLYHRFPDAHEGRLTRLRAALVRRETLAQFALDTHIHEAILLGRGEEENQGRQRASNLCDAFEAVVGAIYLDQGVASVRQMVQPLFERALDDIIRTQSDKDAKSRLQEWVQAHLGLTPRYETIDSRGPDHAKEFTVAVYIGDQKQQEGTGRSKQAAAQAAASATLDVLLNDAHLNGV